MIKDIKCPYCEKLYSKNGLGTHVWKNHGNGITHNPNAGYMNGRIAWNKGLTKDTNASVASAAQLMKGKSPSIKGKTHSIESRKKMSESAKIAFAKGIHATWKTRKKLQSYPEKYTEKKLIESGITSYVKEFPITVRGEKTTYFLDFYFENMCIDLEIDGGTHRFTEIKEKDKNRDEYLLSIGIQVIRIPWNNKKEFDDALINFIKSAGVA